jgi:hypothetical protein
MTPRTAMLALGAAVALTGVVPSVGGATRATTDHRLIGTWERTNSCTALVRAMRRARLNERVMRESIAGGGYYSSPTKVDLATPCKGAVNVRHSHFFTAAGAFGSRDETGSQVDDGDYRIIARNTLTFPSHQREFGFRIRVRYRIAGDSLRFTVLVPHRCVAKCQVATAWAISAFYAGPPFRRQM